MGRDSGVGVMVDDVVGGGGMMVIWRSVGEGAAIPSPERPNLALLFVVVVACWSPSSSS